MISKTAIEPAQESFPVINQLIRKVSIEAKMRQVSAFKKDLVLDACNSSKFYNHR